MSDDGQARAVFGGGCFWCLEAVYQRVDGVIGVTSGYAGGELENPTYREVCAKHTGHAEVVEVVYDPAKVGYERLLELFWQMHDPTTKDRQGADVGPQYRSVILAADEEQERLASASRVEVQKSFSNPIVTEIKRLDKFWPAEAEHDDYYNRNRGAMYCQVVIKPKLDKLGM